MANFALRNKTLFILLIARLFCAPCFSQSNTTQISNELKELQRIKCFDEIMSLDSFPSKYTLAPDSLSLYIMQSSALNVIDSLLVYFSDTSNFKMSKLVYSCSFQGSKVLEILSCKKKLIFLISKSCKKANFYIDSFNNFILSIYFSTEGIERIQDLLHYINEERIKEQAKKHF
jgi:hypothetical protein